MPKEINLEFRIDQREARQSIPRAIAEINPRRFKRLSPRMQDRVRTLMGFARGSRERRIVYLRMVEFKCSAEAAEMLGITWAAAKEAWESILCRERLEKRRIGEIERIKKLGKRPGEKIMECDHE